MKVTHKFTNKLHLIDPNQRIHLNDTEYTIASIVYIIKITIFYSAKRMERHLRRFVEMK